MHTVLYLHGFLSTSNSKKAQILHAASQAWGVQFCAPDLNASPQEVAERLQRTAQALSEQGSWSVVGASLGGFYAAWLAQRAQVRAVLINPAVRPWTFMQDYVGTQTIYGTTRTLEVQAGDAEGLKALAVDTMVTPERCLVLLSPDDEVLDYREAREHYRTSPQLILPASDHAVSDYAQYVNMTLAFALMEDVVHPVRAFQQ